MKSICRRQNKCDSKTKICFGNSRKQCEKRGKCRYPAFTAFKQYFQKVTFSGLLSRVEIFFGKGRKNCGKGENAGY